MQQAVDAYLEEVVCQADETRNGLSHSGSSGGSSGGSTVLASGSGCSGVYCPEPLRAAMAYTLLAPSKRARAVLLLLTSDALSGNQAPALPSAAAIEMLHAASLILDDLPAMDDAQVRRGKAANHLTYGEDTAILASVGLINLAYRLVNSATGLSGEARSRISLILADSVGPCGLTGGQFDDLKGSAASASRIEGIEHVHLRKTARLFSAACEIGAVTAGRGDVAPALARFGEAIGLSFQAYDDLLDASGKVATLGKDVGQDAGKPTVVSAAGIETARQRAEAHMQHGLDQLAQLPASVREPLAGYAAYVLDGMKLKAAA